MPMLDVPQKIFYNLKCLATAIVAVAPAQAFAVDGGSTMFGHLSTDGVTIAILASSTLLLTGFLIRLRQMYNALSRKAEALDKSEKHIQMIGDNLPNETLFQLACAPGNRFSFNYVTKGYERATGIDRHRVLQDAKLAFDPIYESDIPVLQKAHQLAMETLAPADLEIRVLDISGNLKWIRISAVPHRENGGLVWDGFMQDISDRKKIEETLTEEKRNFQNLFGTIDDFLLVCDMNGNLLHANPSVERRLGYGLAELCSMSLFELYPEKLHTEAYQVIALMQSEQSTACNFPLQMKNGGTIPVEMNIFQGFWKNHKAIFGIARDIGSRRQAETALRESQQMLQLIMNTIPMSVFWTDKDSVCLGGNKSFMKECGLGGAEDVAGKTPYDLFGHETATRMVESDQQVINTNQPLLNDLRSFTRLDNSIGWRETSKFPLHNEDGSAVGVLVVWRDVTEQRQAEERLKRTLEDMERFNQLMRGRERRTLELKAEINTLLAKMGRETKYQTTAESL